MPKSKTKTDSNLDKDRLENKILKEKKIKEL